MILKSELEAALMSMLFILLQIKKPYCDGLIMFSEGGGGGIAKSTSAPSKR